MASRFGRPTFPPPFGTIAHRPRCDRVRDFSARNNRDANLESAPYNGYFYPRTYQIALYPVPGFWLWTSMRLCSDKWFLPCECRADHHHGEGDLSERPFFLRFTRGLTFSLCLGLSRLRMLCVGPALHRLATQQVFKLLYMCSLTLGQSEILAVSLAYCPHGFCVRPVISRVAV